MRYESASWTTVTRGCQPGTLNLSKAIREAFPTLAVMEGAYGCFNDRAIAGSDVPSLHREGRALDLGVPEPDRGNKGAGWRCACALASLAPSLHVQLLLWDRHTFRGYGEGPWTWREMQPNTQPHHDHIHVELRWKGARVLTRSFAASLLATWLRGHPPPT